MSPSNESIPTSGSAAGPAAASAAATISPVGFGDRLAAAILEKASALVVGLDPDLSRFPTAILSSTSIGPDDRRERAAAAILRFNAAVIARVAPFAAAVKPQIAFYERWGPPGLQAYEETIALAHHAGLLVIGDVKRGDIGSTALAYAQAHLETADVRASADAVTVNAYLGVDGVQPFMDVARRRGAGVFVLVRTSNPSAAEFQDLRVGDLQLHEIVAERVAQWGAADVGSSGYSCVGAVVGATAPDTVRRLRARMPHTFFLLPGVGAQGGSAQDVVAAFDNRGLGAVVNSSRGILYPYRDPADVAWLDAVADAARSLRDELRDAARRARS